MPGAERCSCASPGDAERFNPASSFLCCLTFPKAASCFSLLLLPRGFALIFSEKLVERVREEGRGERD